MNLFVADPHWHWWIVFYFFLGGIAAGAYFTATLIELAGSVEDRALARAGYWVALPLIGICGILLILDLDRPERFWHMLLRSEVVHDAVDAGWPRTGESWSLMVQAPLLKYWSPMSIGSWALLLFGFCSSLSFLGSLRAEGRLARWLRQGVLGRTLQVFGCVLGFFVAAYTGALLTATNQPLWSDTPWIAALFLTSAASTGIAAVLLLAHRRRDVPTEALRRLERADVWALALEMIVFAIFLISLSELRTSVRGTWQGKLLVFGTFVIGMLMPVMVHMLVRGAVRWRVLLAASCALLGGFVLRYAVLATPPQLLQSGAAVASHSDTAEIGTPSGLVFGLGPEDGRQPGQPGADPGNRPGELEPRTKIK